jgi:excinuclease ABC subunit B
LPEVKLVAILDADKEGFLRSSTSLVQTIGRAARNVEGKVVLYADTITPSMRYAMDETSRRRRIQTAFNEEHDITPQSIKKAVRSTLLITTKIDGEAEQYSAEEKAARVKLLTDEMRAAARELEFEHAAKLRDEIKKLSGEEALERAAKPKPGTIGAKRRNRGRSRK